MIPARTASGGVLRRLASSAETRCTPSAAAAAAAAAAASIRRTQSSVLAPPRPTVSASTSASTFSLRPLAAALFHTSAPRAAGRRRRKPRFSSVHAADMGLIDDKAIDAFAKDKFPAYTPAETAALRQTHSPAQMAAVEAGEAAIDPRDLTIQGRLRVDDELLNLRGALDDFRLVRPGIDQRQKDPKLAAKMAVGAKLMTMEQVEEHTLDWMRSYYVDDTGKPDADKTQRERERAAQRAKGKKMDFGEYMKHLYFDPTMVHADGKTPLAHDELGDTSLVMATPHYIAGVSGKAWRGKDAEIVAKYAAQDKALAADVARLAAGQAFDPAVMEAESREQASVESARIAEAVATRDAAAAKRRLGYLDDTVHSVDETPAMTDIKRQTGLMTVELNKMIVKQLVSRAVSNQTRMGKIQSFSVMSVVGNGNGRLGLGMAKSTEMQTAIKQSRYAAMRNMRPIRRYEDRTIYGNVEAKVAGTVVKLYARPPGFGLRVPHRIFEMARAAGISDLAAKIPRSRNGMNSVKAAYQALTSQPDPEQIAIGRGKKLVDVRKVYYGGAVY